MGRSAYGLDLHLRDAGQAVSCVGLIVLWYAIGTAWWWRAFAEARRDEVFGESYAGTVLVPLTWFIYSSLGPVPWLIVRPEDYRGP